MSRAKGTPHKIDISGLRFGRWLVVERIAGPMWRCVCDCGTIKGVGGHSLKTGVSPSCGCISRERSTKHGMEGTKLYNTWAQMLSRCNNPKAQSYKYYGAKGIKVCDRWKSFENFYTDMGEKPDGKTLDRIDSSGDYSKENCRWSTANEQARNRVNTSFVEYEGRQIAVAALAEKVGVKRKVILERLKRGLTIELAISKQRFGRWGATKSQIN